MLVLNITLITLILVAISVIILTTLLVRQERLYRWFVNQYAWTLPDTNNIPIGIRGRTSKDIVKKIEINNISYLLISINNKTMYFYFDNECVTKATLVPYYTSTFLDSYLFHYTIEQFDEPYRKDIELKMRALRQDWIKNNPKNKQKFKNNDTHKSREQKQKEAYLKAKNNQ